MGAAVNSPGAEFCPAISPDGKFLFFTSDRRRLTSVPDHPLAYREFQELHFGPQNIFGDIYWINANVIAAAMPLER